MFALSISCNHDSSVSVATRLQAGWLGF